MHLGKQHPKKSLSFEIQNMFLCVTVYVLLCDARVNAATKGKT